MPWRRLVHGWDLLAAYLDGTVATRVKSASRWQIERIRYEAAYRRGFDARLGYCHQQSFRIGMKRIAKHLLCRRYLAEGAGVHHPNSVTYLGSHG
jgi:hypothetical protein